MNKDLAEKIVDRFLDNEHVFDRWRDWLEAVEGEYPGLDHGVRLTDLFKLAYRESELTFDEYQKGARKTAKYHNPFVLLLSFFHSRSVFDLWKTWAEDIDLMEMMNYFRYRSVFGYLATALSGEVGELNNLLKKFMRGDPKYKGADGNVSEEGLVEIRAEIGDILWYVSELCTELGIGMGFVAEANLLKLEDRAKKGALKDDGRTDR